MGYADELYTLNNVKCGYRSPIVVDEYGRITGGELMDVYFKKGKFFGRIQKAKGRRIAMSSKGYKGPSKKGTSEESIWGTAISNSVPENYTFERLDERNKSDFEKLLKDHQELDANLKKDYAAVLHGYANKSKPYYTGSSALWPYALLAKAARKYLEQTRVGRRRAEDRQKAKQEHLEFIQECFPDDSNHDQRAELTGLPLIIPTPPESPMDASSLSPQFLAATGSPTVQLLETAATNSEGTGLGEEEHQVTNDQMINHL